MDQPQQENFLQLLLLNMQPQDNTIRRQAEERLLETYRIMPDHVIDFYLEFLPHEIILQQDPKAAQAQLNLKYFVVIQLKNVLSVEPTASYPFIWPLLSPGVQQRIKDELPRILMLQENEDSSMGVAKLMGNLGANLLKYAQQDIEYKKKASCYWPLFKETLYKYFTPIEKRNIHLGFSILEGLFDEKPTLGQVQNLIPTLYMLFQTALDLQSQQALTSSLKCFKSFLEILTLESKKYNQYQLLIKKIKGSVEQLLLTQGNSESLKILAEMLEVNPRFFKSSFEELLFFLGQLFGQPQRRWEEKDIIREMVADYCCFAPSLFKNSKNFNILIHMMVQPLMESARKVPDRWKHPSEGFDVELSDQPHDINMVNFAWTVQKIIEAVGKDKALQFMRQNVRALLNYPDESCLYVGLILLSKIAYILPNKEMIGYVDNLFCLAQTHNPLTRYAALDALGMFAHTRQKGFIRVVGQTVFQKLLRIVKEEQIPRVLAHAIAALTNIVESLTYANIESSYQIAIDRLIQLLENSISVVQETALLGLGSIAEVVEDNFQPFLHKFMVLFKFIFEDRSYMRYEYVNLKGSALQALGCIVSHMPKQYFSQYFQFTIQVLFNLESNPDVKPSTQCILTLWRCLGQVFSEELEEKMKVIGPALLDTIAMPIQMGIEAHKQGSETIESSQIQDIREAAALLSTFADYLPCITTTFFQKVNKIFSAIIVDYPVDLAKEKAIILLHNFIKNIPDAQDKRNISKRYVANLLDVLAKMENLTSSCLLTIEKILSEFESPLLTMQDIQAMEKYLFWIVNDKFDKKNKILSQLYLDEDECKDVNENLRPLNQYLQAVSSLFSCLFKIYKGNLIQLSHRIIAEIFPRVFRGEEVDQTHLFGLCLLDDIIEYIPYSHLSDFWKLFQAILFMFMENESSSLRRAASYGLGVMAQNVPAQLKNADSAREWLQKLKSVASRPISEDEGKRKFNCARDNAISAIGKIIISYRGLMNLEEDIEVWLLNLPLIYDTDESQIQTSILIYLLNQQSDLVVFDQAKMYTILKVLAETIKQQLYKEDIAQHLCDCLSQLRKCPVYIQNQESIDEGLGEELCWEILEFCKYGKQ